MIRINLLTPRSEAPPARPPVSSRLPRAMVVCALCVPPLVLAGYHQRLQRLTSAVDMRVRAAELRLAEISGEAEAVEVLDARRTTLQAQLALVDGIRASRLTTVDMLEATSASLPEGVWLTRLTESQASGSATSSDTENEVDSRVVEVEGRAESIAAVTGLAESLEASGAAGSTVEVVRAIADPEGGAAPVHFTVRATGVRE